MVQLIFNQQSLPTSLLGFVKNEVEKIGNGRLMHPSIKNYFGILLRWFYAGATLFVYKVCTVIERLFLWMVLRPALNPSIMRVFNLCSLPWACLTESTFPAVGVVLFLFLTSPHFFCLFCITLPYHSQDFFPDGQNTVSETFFFWVSVKLIQVNTIVEKKLWTLQKVVFHLHLTEFVTLI